MTAETERRLRSERTNTRRHRLSLTRGIGKITERLALATDDGGYPIQAIHYGKRVRLGVLKARLVALDTRGCPNVVRGGHRLWNGRAQIESELARRLAEVETRPIVDRPAIARAHADATSARLAWRERWDSARLFIRALGSKDELGGNLTVRVDPVSGICSLLLPAALRHFANDHTGKRYVLDDLVVFSYRADEWRERTANAAVTYTVTHHPERRGRWYLDASWSYATMSDRQEIRQALAAAATVKRTPCTASSLPPGPALIRGSALGVDFNADHLAAWILDGHGNPVGPPIRIPLLVKGLAAPIRDGHVREAISELLRIATEHEIGTIVCEDLGWGTSTGRDEATQGRAFRALIAGFPTSTFKTRLGAMAARAGVDVVAVDPAYTSKWGVTYWQRPTSTSSHQTTGHEAAAIVIGRRGQCHRASRRAGVTSTIQSDSSRRATAYGNPATDHQVQDTLRRTPAQSGALTRDRSRTRLATTVRAGPVVNDCQQL